MLRQAARCARDPAAAGKRRSCAAVCACLLATVTLRTRDADAGPNPHQVSGEEILDTMRLVHRAKGWLIEGAAAVALAAFQKTATRYEGKTVAIVICGGNLSQRVKDLL